MSRGGARTRAIADVDTVIPGENPTQSRQSREQLRGGKPTPVSNAGTGTDGDRHEGRGGGGGGPKIDAKESEGNICKLSQRQAGGERPEEGRGGRERAPENFAQKTVRERERGREEEELEELKFLAWRCSC